MELKNVFIVNDIMWHFDPHNKFHHLNKETIANSLGLIPMFFHDEMDDVVKEALEHYGFGGPPMTGGIIDDEGVYLYPGDPELYPLSKGAVKDKIIYIYSYGIVAFVDVDTKGETVVYRFD